MKMRIRALLTCLIFSPLAILAQPATQPGNAPQGNTAQGNVRPGMMLERLQMALKDLNLTDDQKKQVETIMAEVRSQIKDLREKARNGGDAQEIREQARQIMLDVREKLTGILDPEQQAKMRDALRPPGDAPGDGAGNRQNGERRRNRDNPDAPKDSPKDAPPKDASMDPMQPKDNAPTKPDAPKAPDAPAALQPGSAAPDFNLLKLDGKTVQLASFKGRPLVLIFGSASSPSFRDRAKSLQDLYRDLGSKASFFIVYTKEAHATGEWEVDRNKDDKISISQHVNLDDRIKLAKQTREGLKITIPFGVDSMDNAMVSAYASEENSAYVIARDGTVLGVQKWCDPYRLRTLIEKSLATTSPPSTSTSIPSK